MTLYVEAVDQGLTSRTGMATVSVRIHDENDHRPEIKVESSKAGGLSEVSEEEKSTALLAVFTVVDEDSGVNGRITCKVSARGHSPNQRQLAINNWEGEEFHAWEEFLLLSFQESLSKKWDSALLDIVV